MATPPAFCRWAAGALPGLSGEQAHRLGAREVLGQAGGAGGREAEREEELGVWRGWKIGVPIQLAVAETGVRTSRSFCS